jgi:uncharacterized protein YbjT (DUF2867 family)
LVTGANGFIGAAVTARLRGAGHDVIAGARNPVAARQRYADWQWVALDFATPAAEWESALTGVDVIVNCVGVLQDGGEDATHVAHVAGLRAKLDAGVRSGVRRFIHISAVGADDAAGTDYAKTKAAGERLVLAARLDAAVLRPSLVLQRGVYGGSALVRGLSGLPFVTPLAQADAAFRPLHVADLCDLIVTLITREPALTGTYDVAGPHQVTLAGLIGKQRAWLGFGPAPVWRVPAALTGVVGALADIAGALGWKMPFRTTGLKQMAYDVSGDPARLEQAIGFRARSIDAAFAAEPATVQDRWHARLYLIKPAARLIFAAFWILTGVVCLTTGRAEAEALARQAGLGALGDGLTS